MSVVDVLSLLFLLAGQIFFIAGSVGLLRFPDIHGRLHALSKADNLGLGLTSIGLALRASVPSTGVKILTIWFLALVASSVTSFVIAEWEMDNETYHQ